MYDRHVGFTSDTDLDDNQPSDTSEMKLRRRDTPHHLKNKRINTAITNKDDAEEQVRAILAATQGGGSMKPAASVSRQVSGETGSASAFAGKEMGLEILLVYH